MDNHITFFDEEINHFIIETIIQHSVIFFLKINHHLGRSLAGLGVEFVSRKFLFSIDVPLGMVRFSVNLSSDEPIVGDG